MGSLLSTARRTSTSRSGTWTSGAVANEVTFDHPAAHAAWEQVRQWLDAVKIQRTLSRSRIGFLGHPYPGMLDMYSDYTQHTGQLGIHVEVLEMDDLEMRVSAERKSVVEFALPLQDIVQPNGERLLWGVAG